MEPADLKLPLEMSPTRFAEYFGNGTRLKNLRFPQTAFSSIRGSGIQIEMNSVSLMRLKSSVLPGLSRFLICGTKPCPPLSSIIAARNSSLLFV